MLTYEYEVGGQKRRSIGKYFLAEIPPRRYFRINLHLWPTDLVPYGRAIALT